jgi:hypothetical protein
MLFGRRGPHRFGGRPIRARLRTRHRNRGHAVLFFFYVRTLGTFLDRDRHRAIGFIFHGIGNVETVIAAQLDGYVFID